MMGHTLPQVELPIALSASKRQEKLTLSQKFTLRLDFRIAKRSKQQGPVGRRKGFRLGHVRTVFDFWLLGKLLQLLTSFSFLTPLSACLVQGHTFAVCLHSIWRAEVCCCTACSSYFHTYGCSHPFNVSWSECLSRCLLAAESLFFHCFLLKEAGNCKPIWNSIFVWWHWLQILALGVCI